MGNQNTTEEKQILKKNNTSFKGDVFRLVGGTVIAQIIGIITVPVISRFFGPEAYGTTALFLSITGVLAVVSCWRYEIAIVVPEKDEEAASVFFVSLFSALITTLLTSVLTAFYAEPIFRFLKSESLLPFKWFIPVFVLLHGFFLAFNSWNNRTKRFNKIALAGVLNSTSTRLINIITGLSGKASGGAMIGAYTAGQAIAASTLGLQIAKNDSRFLKTNFSFGSILEAIKRYKKFPLISIWSAFLNTLSINLPPILLTYYFNSAIVGFFSFGHRLLTFPMSLIGNSISQVFFQRSSEAKQNQTLDILTEKTIKILVVSIFPTMLLMVIAPDLFGFVFGEQWIEAGIYARILAPWMLGVFICSPISSISDLLNKQEISLLMNILLLLTRAISIIIGGVYQNIYLALICFSLSGALIFTSFNLYCITLTGIPFKRIAKILLSNFLSSITFLLPILVIKTIFPVSYSIEFSLAALLLVLNLIYIYKTNKQFKNCIKPLKQFIFNLCRKS